MININPFSSDPAMADFYKEYHGEHSNISGSLSDGTSSLIPIITDIRHCLLVKAQCEEAVGGVSRKFDADYSVTGGDNNTFIVTIEVPSGCICYYSISGYICKDAPIHKEQGTGTGSVDPQHAGGHRHDGNDSHTIAYSVLTGKPTLFDPSQLIVYIPVAGTSGAEKRNSTGVTYTYTKPGTGQYVVTASGVIFDIAGAGHSIGHCNLEGGAGIGTNLTVLITFVSTTVFQIDISDGTTPTNPPAGLFVTINI